MSNPYNQNTQEGKYLTWDHAFNSNFETDNPYDKESDPDLHHVWGVGFRANKNRVKPEPKPVVNQTTIEYPKASAATDTEGRLLYQNLSEVSTEALLTEVTKRLQEFEITMKRVKKLLT